MIHFVLHTEFEQSMHGSLPENSGERKNTTEIDYKQKGNYSQKINSFYQSASYFLLIQFFCREGAKFIGTYGGQEDFFVPKKSHRLVIFSPKKSPRSVIFSQKKVLAPSFFSIKKVFAPVIFFHKKGL